MVRRDRGFASYADLESRFERRPSLWVQPVSGFEEGAVELVVPELGPLVAYQLRVGERSIDLRAASRRRFERESATTTQALVDLASQPRSRATFEASRTFWSSPPTSAFTSAMTVFSSITSSEPVGSCKASTSMIPRSP